MSGRAELAARPVPRSWTLASIGLGFFVPAFDSLLLTAGGPTLAGELRGIELVGWLFTAYLLMWTVTGPLFGKLSDLHGRRPILVVGLGFFVLGSLPAVLAQSMEQVIACRLVQGIGAGAIGPVSYTAAGDLFPPAQRAKAQLLFSIVYFVAAVLAPPLGALLVVNFSWRAIFLVDVALGLLAVACIAYTLREQVERRAHRLDLAGAAALMVGAGALMLALAVASREGTWASPAQLGLYALAVVSTMAFVWQERRTSEPLVPLHLFHSRVIAGSCLVTLSLGACVWTYSAFVPLFVQGVLDGSPLQAGLASVPINVGWLLTNILAVPLLWRWGYRAATVGGMAALVAGFAVLAQVESGQSLAYPLVLVAMLVQGLGLGFASTVVVVAVQNAVPWDERGAVTAGATFFRSFGPSLLISALQTILNARVATELAARRVELDQLSSVGLAGAGLTNALVAPELRASLAPAALDQLRAALEVSLHQTFWLLSAVALLGCLAAFLLPGGSPERHVWREEATAARPREARG
jgi:EmrB/QacA subfamily drug resistance transporter